MTAELTSGDDYRAALTDLLNYCRDARHSLGAGHALGPLLLKDAAPRPGATWSINDDWALAKQMKLLRQQQLEHCRQLVGLATPVVSSPLEHGPALRIDLQQNRQDLKLWSLLWAYYMCAMSHDELAGLCGWTRRNNELLIKQGRDTYVLQKLVELASAPASAERTAAPALSATAPEQADEPDTAPEQPDEPAAAPHGRTTSPQPGSQKIVNNAGIAIIGNVVGSTVQQFNRSLRGEKP